MKTFILLSALAINVMALEPSKLSVIIPTAKPTVTDDIWQCALSAYTPFFDPPKPTGTLRSAIESYGLELLGTCTDFGCPYPDATRWCGFTTAAPTAVLPAYTSYASSASVWWANHSSSAIDLATECPHYWYRALNKMPTNGGWLNQTIINAECFAGSPEAQSSSSKIASASATPSSMSSAVTSPLKPSSAASASSSVATSSASTKRISTDGTCGGLQGFTCEGSAFGDCCSSYGWCGTSEAHCGSGCNFGFGLCKAPNKVSPDGTCGTTQNNFGWICPGSGFGNCCSAYGWCGSTEGHCAANNGCQSGYGDCNAAVNALTAREAPTSPAAQHAVVGGTPTNAAVAATGSLNKVM